MLKNSKNWAYIILLLLSFFLYLVYQDEAHFAAKWLVAPAWTKVGSEGIEVKLPFMTIELEENRSNTTTILAYNTWRSHTFILLNPSNYEVMSRESRRFFLNLGYQIDEHLIIKSGCNYYPGYINQDTNKVHSLIENVDKRYFVLLENNSHNIEPESTEGLGLMCDIELKIE